MTKKKKSKVKKCQQGQFEIEYYNPNAENVDLLICSPLRLGEKINSICKPVLLAQKNIKFVWTSFASKGNASYNRMKCYNRTKQQYPDHSFKYVIFIDRDILWVYEKALNEMLTTLENSGPEIAFSYCSFKYIGDIQHSFYADEFNLRRLLQNGNYISTMSMIKISAFNQIGGFDVSLKRFQDWDLWIRFGLNFFEGLPVNPGFCFFHAITDFKRSISSKPITSKDLKFLEKYRKQYSKLGQL